VTISNENAIDKTIVDTYTLTVDENGVLGVVVDPVVSDNSTSPDNGSHNFFTGSNGFIEELRRGGDALQSTDVPLSNTAAYSFPSAKPPLSTVFNSQTIRT
jgi:hypothetical protein